jgi:NAD(P)-dependent dehydrogenase (short-subunit alcohol dehydrogenase family)
LTNQKDFQGRVALVTGGGTGIGRAAAWAFATRGAAVVVAGRRAEELEAVVAELERVGSRAFAVSTDVSSAEAVERLVRTTVEQFGRLDAAFNNAGVEGVFAPIETMSEADFDATMTINLKGAWLCCKHELAAMRALGNGGAIVNTSSWLAHGAFPGSSIYSASKAAHEGMIRALAQESVDAGIRVNNVAPGIIDTPMFRRFADATAARPFIDHTPMRRLGTAEDVADVVVWLCSDASRFVTAQSILVDGGYTIPGHRAWMTGDVRTSFTTPSIDGELVSKD